MAHRAANPYRAAAADVKADQYSSASKYGSSSSQYHQQYQQQYNQHHQHQSRTRHNHAAASSSEAANSSSSSYLPPINSTYKQQQQQSGKHTVQQHQTLVQQQQQQAMQYQQQALSGARSTQSIGGGRSQQEMPVLLPMNADPHKNVQRGRAPVTTTLKQGSVLDIKGLGGSSNNNTYGNLASSSVTSNASSSGSTNNSRKLAALNESDEKANKGSRKLIINSASEPVLNGQQSVAGSMPKSHYQVMYATMQNNGVNNNLSPSTHSSTQSTGRTNSIGNMSNLLKDGSNSNKIKNADYLLQLNDEKAAPAVKIKTSKQVPTQNTSEMSDTDVFESTPYYSETPMQATAATGVSNAHFELQQQLLQHQMNKRKQNLVHLVKESFESEDSGADSQSQSKLPDDVKFQQKELIDKLHAALGENPTIKVPGCLFYLIVGAFRLNAVLYRWLRWKRVMNTLRTRS
jgi:hypothetical protein